LKPPKGARATKPDSAVHDIAEEKSNTDIPQGAAEDPVSFFAPPAIACRS